MFKEMNGLVNKFDNTLLKTIEPTQKMIDIVANQWEKQHKDGDGVNLTPDHCKGMTQLQIDATTRWLYKNN